MVAKRVPSGLVVLQSLRVCKICGQNKQLGWKPEQCDGAGSGWRYEELQCLSFVPLLLFPCSFVLTSLLRSSCSHCIIIWIKEHFDGIWSPLRCYVPFLILTSHRQTQSQRMQFKSWSQSITWDPVLFSFFVIIWLLVELESIILMSIVADVSTNIFAASIKNKIHHSATACTFDLRHTEACCCLEFFILAWSSGDLVSRTFWAKERITSYYCGMGACNQCLVLFLFSVMLKDQNLWKISCFLSMLQGNSWNSRITIDVRRNQTCWRNQSPNFRISSELHRINKRLILG